MLTNALAFLAFCLLVAAVFASIAPVPGADWLWAGFTTAIFLAGGLGYVCPERYETGQEPKPEGTCEPFAPSWSVKPKGSGHRPDTSPTPSGKPIANPSNEAI